MSYPTSFKVQNTNGYLSFNGDAIYACESLLCKIHTDEFYALDSDDYILIQNHNLNANIDVVSYNSSINLNSVLNSNNAIVINASNTAGGIQLFAGSGGVSTVTSNGDINMSAQGANINIGVSPIGTPAAQQTQNVNIEAFNTFAVSAADMYFVSSDVISFVSNTGDIEFGTSNGAPVIKLQNGNLLVNQSSSDLDRQVDIAVTHQSNSKPGYNGLVINTFNSNVASDLTLQTSNTIGDRQAILSMGVFPDNDKYAGYQIYFGYQTANCVIRLDGPAYTPNRSSAGFGVDFTDADVGKSIYFPLADRKTIIQSLGTIITANSNASQITVSGTYTGSSSRVYLLQIDSTAVTGPNTFMWSNDGGVTFQATFIPITGGVQPLENGLSIQFAATSGYTLYQQFIFQAKIVAFVDTVVTPPITPIGEPFYSLQPYHAYFGTETPSDLVIKTNNREKMRITADGAIGIQQNNPNACLELDSNYNKILVINQTTAGFQINPSISQINTGGYVVVWNSQNLTIPNTDIYDVYGQIYLTDGTRYGNNFKINVTLSDYQSFPTVAGQRTIDSPYFATVWGSNNAGTYDVFAQIIHNTIPLYNFDILVGTGGPSSNNYNQPYPRIAGLYNGNYIIVWAAYDSGTTLTTIKGRIMNNSGSFVTSVFNVSNPAATTSRNYPYVAGLPDNDPYLPNGFVVGFMVKVDTGVDSRYTISVRLFNSSGTPASAEIPITTIGSLLYSNITDGLLSVAEINNNSVNSTANGGFILSFYRNYLADATLYNVSDGVIGTQSGATASIAALDPSNRILSLQNVSNRFLIGEEVLIASTVPNVGTGVEQVAAIDFTTTNTANVTMGTGYRNVVSYRFNSNMTSVNDALWNVQVNSSTLYEDLDRVNVPSNSTVFAYKRPLAATAVNNSGTAIVSWSNGSIPSVYYQLLDVATGNKIGTEQRITSQYDGLKQRDQVVAHLQSIEDNDFGFVVSWDNQDLDLSGAGVYQQLIGYEHDIVRFEDGNNEIILNHNGQVGIGTFSPSATLHIHSPQTSAFNDPPNPATLLLQNTAQHIITPDAQQAIYFNNGDNVQLGTITVTNSLRYNDLYPQPTALIGFYKFDQEQGTQVPDSSSSSTSSNLAIITYVNTNGILVNFDIENCWVAGLINNALAFSGANNYVFVEATATNGLNTVLETANQMSVSVWVNVASDIVVGSVMDIVSNGGDLALAGTYLLNLSDLSSNGAMYVCSNIVVDTATDIGVIGTSRINDGNWHLINMCALVGSGSDYLKLYVDGVLEASTSFSNTVTYVQHSGVATTFGVRNSVGYGGNTYFRGYMDELRFYDTVLTQNEITQLYTYGSQQRGTVIIAANSDNNVNSALVIDDTGDYNNLSAKPLPFSVLSGVITAYFGNKTITGVNTAFTSELAAGDIIVLDTVTDVEFTVISIESDTSATLNVRGYNGPEVSKAYQSVLRKPNMFSFYDNGDNIRGYINNYGNLTVGNGASNSKLEVVSDTSNLRSLPEVTITNTDISDTANSRRTAINFAGYDATSVLNPPKNLVQIIASHYQTAADNKGMLQIGINDGSSTSNVVSIISNGNMGLGGQNEPIAQLHLYRNADKSTMVMESGAPQDNAVFDEQSYMYFAGTTSIGQTISTNINDQMLAAIRASNDSNTFNLDGRIDIMTNNLTDNTNGLETRMSVTHTGNVGIGVLNPLNTLQVAPELRIGDNINTIVAVSGGGFTVQVSQNIFINYLTPLTSRQLIGATVIVGNATLSRAKITGIVSAHSMTVDTDFTAYNGLVVYVSIAGLNVGKNGYVGVNTTSPKTMLDVNGGLSLAIYTTTVDLDLGDDDSIVTVLGDTTSGNLNVYLPDNTLRNLVGRYFIIKNIGGNTLTINAAVGDPALIDGGGPFSIPNLVRIRIQSDGTNWWLL